MLKRLPDSSWTYQSAAHLLNRAGFGGRPEEIQKLVDLGLERAVDRLVFYEGIDDPAAPPGWAKPDPTRLERFREFQKAPADKKKEFQQTERRAQRDHLLELRQWWLQRMTAGPRLFQEKMTLFWHGHFATSIQKVRDAYLMWRQNETFRRHATGNWLTLLEEVSKDPAMLIWLDQAQSRKEHPNENYARELMELFTLGEGHYTEKDVLEAARALTGWSYDRARQEFVQRPNAHDHGVKAVLGRTGNLDGEDVLQQILEQPQAPRFLVRKLWTFFAGESCPAEVEEHLANFLVREKYQLKPVVRAMFLSEAFYGESVVGNQVKSPVQWLVSSVKMLERDLPPPMVSSNALRLLGQDLFAPPNVKGWDGGLSWITTNNLLNRYNLAEVLVLGVTSFGPGGGRPGANRLAAQREGGEHRWIEPLNVSKIFPADERGDARALLAALQKRLLVSPLKEGQSKVLVDFLHSQEKLDDVSIRHAIRLVMATPEYQLT